MPVPEKFDSIDYRRDLRTWLWAVKNVCDLAGFDNTSRTELAFSLLDKQPLARWKNRLLQAQEQGTISKLYDWNEFEAWCNACLRKPDCRMHHYDRLHQLQQITDVHDYWADFLSCAARAEVKDQEILVHLWVKGLKPGIRDYASFDPVTCKAWTTVKAAQDRAKDLDANRENWLAIFRNDSEYECEQQLQQTHRASKWNQFHAHKRARKQAACNY